MPPITLTICAIGGYDGGNIPPTEAAQLRVDPSDFRVLPYSLGIVPDARALLMPRPGSTYARENPFHMIVYVREPPDQIVGGARQAFGPAALKTVVKPLGLLSTRPRTTVAAASGA